MAKPTLEQIRTELGDCTRCPLSEGRTNLVFGVGNPKARLMFVGEGPGADEDRQGEPFVGRAGQLLNKIIAAMGLERKEVFIGNVVKCLRYNAMVQLEDKSWERIGRLVNNKYSGGVMSVNAAGQLVPRRVVGWHATPLANRHVYHLTFRTARVAGSAKCGIYLTGDHPVLTRRGYVEVQSLKQGDAIATGQGFSPQVRNLIYGTMLGDGHICRGNAHLSFAHSMKQERYAWFKMDMLQQEVDCYRDVLQVAAGSDQQYPVVRCRTRAGRAFWKIRSEFYADQKRVPASLASELNPMMLAFWFMDDGYVRIRETRRPMAEIATCAFSHEDLTILLQGLERLGVQGYIRNNRIHFSVTETYKLSEVMAPYIHYSMRHKLHPEVEKRIPFNLELFQEERPETMFDDVEAKPVPSDGLEKHFYCIDVEETNNFVTSGGVVHNCRPPQNRAPLPHEAATCMPFLHQQIEAVDPEIIVCLGSIATRYLLEDEQLKIGQVRGQFQDWRGRKLMPTYHPAFLLRNPAMKKPVWDDMQKVMQALGLKAPGQ